MKKELITFKDPKSPVSEVFRTLRTNIQFMNTKSRLKSLLITSTIPGEGKSWVASNLAVTFAQAGKKVVLVDADMRKGRQFNIFGISPTPGLSNYLVGYNSRGEELPEDITTYVSTTQIDNLFVIPAGNVPPNPSELLISEKMIDMIKKLESMFDMVIFDGTPSSIVTDAVIISRFVDTTIIVSAYKETKMDVIERIQKDIKNVGGNIAGVVLNKMPITKKKYESTYYYGSIQERTVNEKKTDMKIKAKQAMRENPNRNASSKDERQEEGKRSKSQIEERIAKKQIQSKGVQSKTIREGQTMTRQTKKGMFDYDKEANQTPQTDQLLREINNYLSTEKAKLKKDDVE